jgi:hypothetical protein
MFMGETKPAPVIEVWTAPSVSVVAVFPIVVLSREPEKVKVVVSAPVPNVTELPDVEQGVESAQVNATCVVAFSTKESARAVPEAAATSKSDASPNSNLGMGLLIIIYSSEYTRSTDWV